MENSQAAECSIPRHGLAIVECCRRPRIRMRHKVPRDPSRIPELMATFHALCKGKRLWPLFIHGDPGVGKSVATYCMTDVLADYIYTDLDELCEALVTRSDKWRHIQDPDKCAILDEIGGRDVVSSVDADAVKKFLDLRENYANRVGIYVSNHSPDAIPELYGHRIASRLLCGTVFHMAGRDQRKS